MKLSLLHSVLITERQRPPLTASETVGLAITPVITLSHSPCALFAGYSPPVCSF